MQNSTDPQSPPEDLNKSTSAGKKPHKESLLLNLLLNVAAPSLILSKFSSDEYLGIKLAIIVALAFPLCYGARDFIRARKINFFSALGIVSVGLTGGITLMELPVEYIAIKEAAIPGLIGLVILVSVFTPYPLVRAFVYKSNILKLDKIEPALEKLGNREKFERSLKIASYAFAGSFFLSSILNYVLAVWILVSEPGTVAFNEELGKMTALSYPVIAIPSTIILVAIFFYVLRTITGLTQLSLEEVMTVE